MASSSNNGFIIVVVSRLVHVLNKLSAVEWLKSFGRTVAGISGDALDQEGKRRASNTWIDIFIVLKWSLIGGFLWCGVESQLAFLLTSYLLFFNAFSYFYYHGWGSEFRPPNLQPEDALWRDRRRLTSFLMAIFFSFLGFAYLYAFQFPSSLEWPTAPNRLDAIFLSVSNSFTLTYEGFQPRDQTARGLLLLQVLNMFVFLTVLIGNSIPDVGRSSG